MMPKVTRAGCRFQIAGWLLVVGILGGCDVPPGIPAGERVVYAHDSLYHHILISEEGENRYIRFGYGKLQGAMDVEEPTALRVPYTAYLGVGLAFVRPQRVLMIGLAGGAMVRFLEAVRPEVKVDVVEIDPEVVTVAGRFFGVREGPGRRIYTGDGRVFVKRARRRYDWVI